MSTELARIPRKDRHLTPVGGEDRTATAVGGEDRTATAVAREDRLPIAGGEDRRLTLSERAARTGERNRDCRTCRAFSPAPAGLGYGWCRAFRMPVKLYHPPGSFFSQCQFRVLTRVSGGGSSSTPTVEHDR